jgi:hypothetical protein
MPWNTTLPADASKLRLSAGYIRANWTALENGDVPYVKLQLAEQGSNPTRANDTGWLFTKQASSQTELYYEDDRNPALVTQITSAGLPIWKGGTTGGTGVITATVAAAGKIVFPNGLTFIWGTFDPNSSTTVTFAGGGFASTCYNIQLTGSADNNSTFRAGVSTGTVTNTQFVFEGSVSSHWTPIYYFAVGA